jgi:hypothetical protein
MTERYYLRRKANLGVSEDMDADPNLFLDSIKGRTSECAMSRMTGVWRQVIASYLQRKEALADLSPADTGIH